MILVAVSTGFFDPLLQRCEELSKKYDFFGQIGSSRFVPSFPHVRLLSPQALACKVQEAELVVSHAGCGMLSLIYRYRKKAVVVPKQKRYGELNDGQVELARRWCQMGLGVLCLDVLKLEEAILKARNSSFPSCLPPSLGPEVERWLLLCRAHTEKEGVCEKA